MRIATVKIKDFNRLGDVFLDFRTCPLLTMIAGTCDSAGADSNGSGKSSVLSAISWCLYGKEIRKNKREVEHVIRNSADSTLVEVVIEHEGKTVMCVSRSRRRSGKVELLVDGKEFGTVQGGQAYIERKLGFTYELFTRTVIFGGDMSAFCQMSPGERTRILEEMLGVHHFLEAEKTAKEKSKESSAQLEMLVAQRQAWKNEVESRRRRFLDHVESYAAVAADYESRRHALQSEIFDSFWLSYRLRERLRKRRIEAKSKEAEYANLVSKHKKDVQEAEARVDKLREGLRDTQSLVDTADAEARIQRNRVRDLKSRKRPDTCPTCGQPWGSRDAALNIKPEEERLKTLEEALDNRRKANEKAIAVYEEAKKALKSLRDNPPQRPEASTGVDGIHDALVECDGGMQAAMASLERLEEETDLRGEALKAVQALDAFRESRSKAFSDEGKINKLTRRIQVLDYWKQAFGKGGLPAILLKATAPELNRLIKPFADYLTAGAYVFDFSLADNNNGQSFFQISVKNVDGGDTYEDLSKGELARVDLCVLLAIRALMQMRSPVKFEQIFLDEIADGLDRTGTEFFIRLLRTKKVAPQVVFISHDNTMQEAADKVFLLEKREGVTRLKKPKGKV